MTTRTPMELGRRFCIHRSLSLSTQLTNSIITMAGLVGLCRLHRAASSQQSSQSTVHCAWHACMYVRAQPGGGSPAISPAELRDEEGGKKRGTCSSQIPDRRGHTQQGKESTQCPSRGTCRYRLYRRGSFLLANRGPSLAAGSCGRGWDAAAGANNTHLRDGWDGLAGREAMCAGDEHGGGLPSGKWRGGCICLQSQSIPVPAVCQAWRSSWDHG